MHPSDFLSLRRSAASAFLLLALLVLATTNRGLSAPLLHREWKVDDVTREALVHVPDNHKQSTTRAPVVFAFHGHGGTMRNAARMFHIETVWPEAIVVYMQGLKTPGHITDPEGKYPGWQRTVGDQQDRDLHFFDMVLASLKADYQVNTNRVYSTGHSNGGAFSYLLLEARANDFAAFAPCAALHLPLIQMSRKDFESDEMKSQKSSLPRSRGRDGRDDSYKSALRANRKPVLHIAAENDELVKYTWQKRFLDQFRSLNECESGRNWTTDKRCILYPSKLGGDLITYIHSGTHKYPTEAPEIIVKFFKVR